MERIEAAVHGWPQAPYETKAEVDANYKRMVEYGCRPEHAEAVHLGVASHNLFDVAYGLLLRASATASSAGSSSRCSRAWPTTRRARCSARAGGLLLYAPVVRAEDFHSAIAYLVRRLDENTAPENFLRHVFDLEPGSPTWDRRARSLPGRLRSQSTPLRRAAPHPGPRGREPAGPVAPPVGSDSSNEPDTDWTLPANRAWIDGRRRALARALAGDGSAPDRRRD